MNKRIRKKKVPQNTFYCYTAVGIETVTNSNGVTFKALLVKNCPFYCRATKKRNYAKCLLENNNEMIPEFEDHCKICGYGCGSEKLLERKAMRQAKRIYRRRRAGKREW